MRHQTHAVIIVISGYVTSVPSQNQNKELFVDLDYQRLHEISQHMLFSGYWQTEYLNYSKYIHRPVILSVFGGTAQPIFEAMLRPDKNLDPNGEDFWKRGLWGVLNIPTLDSSVILIKVNGTCS